MVQEQFIQNGLKAYRSIRSFFKLSDEEKEIYFNEISPENTRRAFYLSVIGIPVSIIHIILFTPKLKVVTGIDHQWVSSIIYTHLAFFIMSLVSGIFLYFSIYRKKINTPASRIYTYILLFFVLILGTALTAFDQYVTPSITPFLNTTILVGLFFQMRPSLSVIYYIASYLIYYLAISQTQLNQEILISNQVNGISVTVISLSLCMILWRSKLTRLLQREQITRQNKALNESNAQKDKFFSIIAHDLTNPFSSILGFSEFLIEEVTAKNYDLAIHDAKIINQSANNIMDLLRNLMEWSRAQTGRIEFKPDTIDLDKLLKETEDLFAASLLHKKISLTIDTPKDAIVYADKNMIFTILRNLISNAIKFTNTEGHIVLSVIKNPHEYLITVSDDGVGIPNKSIDRLFRIDQNKSTKGTQNETGTGLGLILCKELIEKHGGSIWVESEPGKGSKFTFSIPCNS